MTQITNFGILNGRATIEKGIVTVQSDKPYTDKSTVNQVNKVTVENCSIRSDVYFQNGFIRFSVIPNQDVWGCELEFATPDGRKVIGVPSLLGQFCIPNGKTYKAVGDPYSYGINKQIDFLVEVLGSNINLFVNDILLGEGSCVVQEYPITFNLDGDGLKLFDVSCSRKRPLVFTVMQFSDEYNILYDDVIKPICESYHLDCVRGDEFYISRPILKDIIDSITNSSLIIAEITPDNPNVFYEIGYAHALNKPTILLCDRKREKLPFDVSSFRTLFYENSIGGKKKVETDLKRYLNAIFKQ